MYESAIFIMQSVMFNELIYSEFISSLLVPCVRSAEMLVPRPKTESLELLI